MRRFWWLTVALVGTIAAPAWSAGTQKGSVLVVPSRLRVVRLASDMVRLRGVDLVVYQAVPDTGELLIHGWQKGQWVQIDRAAFQAGLFLSRSVGQVVFVGDDEALVRELADAAPWARGYMLMTTLDVGTLAGELGQIYGFHSAEWKWIARRHELALIDLNAGRRYSGRYSRPPRAAPLPEPVPVPESGLLMSDEPPAPTPAPPVSEPAPIRYPEK